MITSLFQNNALSYIISFAVGVLLCCTRLISDTYVDPLKVDLVNYSFFISHKLLIIISFVLCFVSGVILNYIAKKNLFFYEPTNLVLFFFVILVPLGFSGTNYLFYNVVTLALVVFFVYLFQILNNNSIEKQLFNASLITGLLIFHNPFFILLTFLLLQNLGTVKRIGFRESFGVFIGFCIPLAYALLFTILTENVSFWSNFTFVKWSIPIFNWKPMVITLLGIFLSYLGYQLVTGKRSGTDITILRATRNSFIVFIVFLIISLISFFIFYPDYLFFVFSIPLSVFLTQYFTNLASKWKELFFVGYTLVILIAHF